MLAEKSPQYAPESNEKLMRSFLCCSMLPTARVVARVAQRNGSNAVRHSSTAKVWIDKNTKVMVQGLTGKTVSRACSFDVSMVSYSLPIQQGSFHTETSIEYGTQTVAGVTPKKGGTEHMVGSSSIPIFNTVLEVTRL
jgi:succinyl-CoA synthetase alpha subunit